MRVHKLYTLSEAAARVCGARRHTRRGRAPRPTLFVRVIAISGKVQYPSDIPAAPAVKRQKKTIKPQDRRL